MDIKAVSKLFSSPGRVIIIAVQVSAVCRNCSNFVNFHTVIKGYRDEPTEQKIFADISERRSANDFFDSIRPVYINSPTDFNCPEYVPDEISSIFDEGAKALAAECPNAAVAMFRLCLDVSTKPLLPTENTDGLNKFQRENLGPRIKWLFENGLISKELYDLSDQVREDGNDAVHIGTLKIDDAQNIADFTVLFLERQFAEPGRIATARARRAERRAARPE